MKLYVAGPMTGMPEHNLPAFAEATAQLEAAGYEVVNPGRRGVIEGYTWPDYMRMALADLLTCEGVALLPGWEGSDGARLEMYVARKLSMFALSVDFWLTYNVAARS